MTTALPASASALARVLELAVCRVDVRKFVKRLVAYAEALDRGGSSVPPPRLDAGAGVEEEKAVELLLRAVGLSPEEDGRWGLRGEGAGEAPRAGEVLRRVLSAVDALQEYLGQERRGADGALGSLGCAAKAGQGLGVVRDAAKALPTLPGQLPALLGQLRDGELVATDGIANDAVRWRLVALFETVGLERQMSAGEDGGGGDRGRAAARS